MSDSETETDEFSLDADGFKLIAGLMAAQSNDLHKTMDSMYEREKEQRMLLEVHIEDCLSYFAKIALGTTREYEAGVRMLGESRWAGGMTEERKQSYLQRHRRFDLT